MSWVELLCVCVCLVVCVCGVSSFLFFRFVFVYVFIVLSRVCRVLFDCVTFMFKYLCLFLCVFVYV